jgi:hypothetical protein
VTQTKAVRNPWTIVDPLGEALPFLRMSGVFYCRSEFTAPWGLEIPPFDQSMMLNNYDAIMRVIGETDPLRAPIVATQAFRSDNPLRWAKRYLAELQAHTLRRAGPAEAPDSVGMMNRRAGHQSRRTGSLDGRSLCRGG